MPNFLPTYWNQNTPESAYNKDFQEWERSFFQKKDNTIPAFQSAYILANITSVTKLELLKLKKRDCSIIESTTEIGKSFLSIKQKTVNFSTYSAISNPEAIGIPDITETGGIFQIKITCNTNDILYSDIFCMVGVPIATYSCSDAAYDIVTDTFSIKITRTDINPDAFAPSTLTLNMYNSQTLQTVRLTNTNINLEVGGDITLTFGMPNNVFDFFIWSGCCSGSLELQILAFENLDAIQAESNAFFLVE
jgi:hypothetical protein